MSTTSAVKTGGKVAKGPQPNRRKIPGKSHKQKEPRSLAVSKPMKSPKKDMGWLIDLRAAKEALEDALSATDAPSLATAIELGVTATATKPATEVNVYDEVCALLRRANDEICIRKLTPDSLWTISVAHLQKAMDRAVELRKTPLLIDNASGVVESYLRYQSVVTIDGKGLVARKATKNATTEELRDECRAKLVTAMTCGYPLLVNCGTAAPDFLGTFCGKSFPSEVFTTTHHDAFNGKDDTGYTASAVNCANFDSMLAEGDDLRELQRAREVGRVCGFYAMVLTAFELEDFDEFLRFGEFLPSREHFQVIHLSDK